MTSTIHHEQYLANVIRRALDAEEGLHTWATVDWLSHPKVRVTPRAGNAGRHQYEVGTAIARRGIWRTTGGQYQRPVGVSSTMADQVRHSYGELDADLMSVRTASNLIQVGLFGAVVHDARMEVSR